MGIIMIVREAKTEEITKILQEGHKCWHKGRSFEQYAVDNRREEAYGARYVMEVDGRLASSLILLRFKQILKYPVYGIGSVLTMPGFEKKGYASQLIKACMQQIDFNKTMVFLYSEINPLFYEKLGFQKLPQKLQKKPGCSCMVLCSDEIQAQLTKSEVLNIPDYF